MASLGFIISGHSSCKNHQTYSADGVFGFRGKLAFRNCTTLYGGELQVEIAQSLSHYCTVVVVAVIIMIYYDAIE